MSLASFSRPSCCDPTAEEEPHQPLGNSRPPAKETLLTPGSGERRWQRVRLAFRGALRATRTRAATAYSSR